MPEQIFPCPCEDNVPLSTVGYYAIGGIARWLASPRSVSELAALLNWCREHRRPVIVAGKGSNMLFSDEDFPGVVISLASMNRICRISEHGFFCEAGVENSEVAIALQKAGRSGGEWLFRLPGMIGATVRMNGRCYGREISTVTKGVVTVGLDGTVRWRSPQEVFLGYKQTSLMQSPEIVVGALLEFPDGGEPSGIGLTMQGYADDRESKHQFDFPSCGSTFKNNYEAGRPSGQIFDSLGFRGRREGGAQVSGHHANFIFNTGDAKAVDVLRLAGSMRSAARQYAGALLELELQCAGLFDVSLLEGGGISGTPEPSRPGFAWAGLLHAPDDAAALFPRMLMQGLMLDYTVEDCHFPDGISVEVQQLASLAEARRSPDSPFIRWSTHDASGNSFSLRPQAPGGTFVNELWNCSVSELFVADGGSGSSYLEFEETPDGHWVALGFDEKRQRSAGHGDPSETLWEDSVKRFTGPSGFGMELSYALLEPFIHNGHLKLQCCASLGKQQYGLFPWWHDPGTPDFHQPERFCPVRLV
ncbi:MAG: UDP-N-acetylmuramate dehydrogenase [Chlorobiaceae bacterium]|nr:UDP-N-acetylmuramate dehydrogenase [Chlorobiaceae bacterium]